MNKQLFTFFKENHAAVTLMIASKYLTSKQDFIPFIDAGITHFGENRVDSLIEKQEWFKDTPLTWHFIGPLQTKKIKKVIDQIDVFHALDRVKTAEEIDKRRTAGPLPCYIEVNISGEAQKHGVSIDAVQPFIDSVFNLQNVEIIGLMGMASHTDDEAVIDKQFNTLKALRDSLNKQYPKITELSIGMSNDYLSALKHGSTILRLGRIMLTEDGYGSK